MIWFMKLDKNGRRIAEREIDQSDIQRCPHVILMEEHYRNDGSCRCNDKTHTVMLQWGYVWDDGQWINKKEDDDGA